MAVVHHNTIKKAAKYGVTVLRKGDEWFAERDGEAVPLGFGADAQKALVGALAEFEAEQKAEGRKPRAKKAKKPAKRRKPRDDEEFDEDGEDEQEEEGRSVVKRVYKNRYKPHKAKCGDELSKQVSAHVSYKDEDKKLRTDQDKLTRFAKANDCWDPKYKHLNGGMRRMNIVNRLRAKVRKGHEIVWTQ